MVKYLFDRYKIQEMCDKAINSFLPALKLVPDLFFLQKIIKKLYDAVFFNYDMIFFKEDSGNIIFFSDEMGIFSVVL